MPLFRVAPIDSIPPGEARFFCVEGRAISVAHRSGRFYAMDGICPHKQLEMHGAVLWDDMLECPWHHYQFDIRTGACPGGLEPLATYPVEVIGTALWVELA